MAPDPTSGLPEGRPGPGICPPYRHNLGTNGTGLEVNPWDESPMKEAASYEHWRDPAAFVSLSSDERDATRRQVPGIGCHDSV